MTSQQATKLALGFAATVVICLVVVLFNSDWQRDAQTGGEDGILGGEFTLQHLDGTVSLSDFRGQIVVVYFGFLNCPEICPTSMSVIAKALKRLDVDELAQVQPMLISVDPERDSLENLKAFTGYFHPKILGITGSQSDIDHVVNEYGAYLEVIDSTTPGSAYEFFHTSRYYVINQDGELVDAMRHGTTVNELVARIRTLI